MSALRELDITPMRQDEANEIAEWHYPPPYDFYDMAADQRDLAELLGRRGDRYFAARDQLQQLIGFYEFAHAETVVTVGLGLRPDLTGRGLGRSFLETGLAFARKSFEPEVFRLSVAAFNERALTVYERAGFVRTRTFDHETNGGVFSFVEMERPA